MGSATISRTEEMVELEVLFVEGGEVGADGADGADGVDGADGAEGSVP